MTKSCPQLFLSQTPLHKAGRFSEIKKFTLEFFEPDLIDGFQVRFPKVALTNIQKLAGKHGADGRLCLVCKGKQLGVYQRKIPVAVLPKYALALFGPERFCWAVQYTTQIRFTQGFAHLSLPDGDPRPLPSQPSSHPPHHDPQRAFRIHRSK